MTFEQTRRELIAFRDANKDCPALFYRASTAVNLIERLQAPASDEHATKLRRLLSRTMREIDAIKSNGGVYVPSHVEVAA